MKTQKVFGIGFQKTGTTTLGVILQRLGYKVAGYYEFRDLASTPDLTLSAIEDRALDLVTKFDAAKDTPWPILYQRLDYAFPGSRFIHVTRQPEKWIQSAVNDFGSYPNSLHQAIYDCGYPKGNENAWLERYNSHNQSVRDYFSDRPQDCLFLNLEDGIGVEKICDFLGVDLPPDGASVPRANTRGKKALKTQWWKIRSRLGF